MSSTSINEHESRPAGPHGGPVLRIDGGFVELSVFEDGVPPRFRLYFFGPDNRPTEAPSSVLTLETTRPDSSTQVFSFTPKNGYVESTDSIPEPHEFRVRLSESHDGHSHSYETQFTEESHGHDHGGGHGHSHGEHGHAHGKGIFGWIQNTFGHSHSVVDKIDRTMESNERGIWALKASLVGLGFTALIQVIVAVFSGSVGLLADTIHNFADAGTSLPLWVAFALTRRGASRRFTYGYGKTEDVAGVLIVIIIFFSACVAAWESVRKLIHPQPVEHLGWVVFAAIVGFVGNEAVAVFRIRVGEEIGSAALVADGQHARVDGFTSLAVLIGVIGVWFGYPILDPLVGIGITLAILFVVKNAAVSVWMRLIDGIEPEILAQIEHAPMHVAGVAAVEHVRARWVGHTVYTDVEIRVDPRMSVTDAYSIAQQVEQSLRDHVRLLGEAVVRVRPT